MIKLPLSIQKELEYESYNSGSIEREVGELLYSFVRILKPLNILETGTYKGVSAAYMGLACKENDKGMVHTIEFDPSHWIDASNLWEAVKCGTHVHQYKCKVEEYVSSMSYEFIFLDSEPSIRFRELERFYLALEPGGYIFIHDLHRHLSQLPSSNPDHPEFGWPYGELPAVIKTYLKERKLIPFSFPNPRGLTGFYRPRSDDYKI
jgi:predicted O-methyltransferase YrrM